GLVVLLSYQIVAGGPGEPWYVSIPLFLGYTSVPLFTGMAVLRYRLYELDLIISRAVLLALLATFVTVGYVAVVVVIGAALGGQVGGRVWGSLPGRSRPCGGGCSVCPPASCTGRGPYRTRRWPNSAGSWGAASRPRT